MLQGRLLRRVHALGLDSLLEYERLLLGPQALAELGRFDDAVTTHKSDFFREPAHFRYLYKHALPQLASHHRAGAHWVCRVWSAGCSNGQEVYTLAMVLSEFERAHRGFAYSIVATDVSPNVLEHAARAIYPDALAEPIPPALRKRYLLRSKQRDRAEFRVAPELRRRVHFGCLNFMDERYALSGRFEIIFFRNVMIYFDKPTQNSVVRRQCELLKQDGYYFISHTESLAGLDAPLRPVASSVFRKRG